MSDHNLAAELICPKCDDSGVVVVLRADGSRAARECSCRLERRIGRMLVRANVPKRYEHCSLESFETSFPSATPSLKAAHFRATQFVKSYPLETAGNGLLITGTNGLGKTHLAVGILHALISKRGAQGLFCTYNELLKEVQNSYNRQVQATELDVLRPIFKAEVLVLDELGSSKPSDWVWDTVAHILNARYNERLTTIITTNYRNALSTLGEEEGVSRLKSEAPSQSTAAKKARKPASLGDRIGDRMLSRLQEMCVVVEMDGDDFRRTVKAARFG